MNVSELKIIETEAFRNTSLTKIMIPSSVIELKESVFAECNELIKVEFADKSSLKSIKILYFIIHQLHNFHFQITLLILIQVYLQK